jgi:hypothetical protein
VCVPEDALSPQQLDFLHQVRVHDPDAAVFRSGKAWYFRGPAIGEGTMPSKEQG